MDPNQAFLDIIGSNDPGLIMDRVNDLYWWLKRGGFKPAARNTQGKPLPNGWQLTIGGITLFKQEDGLIGMID